MLLVNVAYSLTFVWVFLTIHMLFCFLQALITTVHKMNLCKFVADQLHEELSKGKYHKTCLFLLPVYFFTLY